jgi:hypothetical protein
MLSSIELASRCRQQGLLSKEAHELVLATRERLIKHAMAEKAASIFGDIGARITGAAAKAGAKEVEPAWKVGTKHIAKMLGLGAALAAGGAAAKGILNHSKDKRVRRDIETSYKQMFVETPGLKDMDQSKVTRHFGVLARYAPSLAADPTIAGAWVRGTVQMGHIDSSAVERLAATQAIIDRHHEGKALFQPGHFSAALGVAKSVLGKGAGA